MYHLYVVQVEDRDAVRASLADQQIQTAIHYAVPLHLEPAFSDLGCARGDFPMAEAAIRHILSLPMYPYLQMRICVRSALEESLVSEGFDSSHTLEVWRGSATARGAWQ